MDLNTFKEYIKAHIISLEQDSEELENEMATYEEMESNEYHALEIEDISINGQIIASYHFLRVLDER
jgi:hypothetical protein